MKTVLKVTACMAVCVCLLLGYIKQETKIAMLQSDVEFLQFMDSLQSKRIDNLRQHTFVADSMIIEAIKQFNN
ncbi:hypothetical protein [uncultured Bacteroides sp.]|uniref:hypothetical protein n=1 Tax=uncultured Bacteroides sp. TaxID=162156 RepID=UPI0008226079|nr:hypothetical protein [uncultured Bacteroides sp.]SCI87710.1 Uncharacterised protein [uncultured Bacteroides sp.]